MKKSQNIMKMIEDLSLVSRITTYYAYALELLSISLLTP